MSIPELKNRLYDKWEFLLPTDSSLALFRITIGISVLYNMLFVRLPCVNILYGKHRFFPEEITRHINDSSNVSLFDYIHNDSFALFFLSIGMLSCVLFILGKWTKIAGWLTLFIFWNLLQSNSIFTFGFDHYTFNIFLCGMFLPLNNRWSMDALQSDFKPKKPRLSFTMVMLVQITMIYFLTGILKNGDSWIHGYAVRNMLSDPYTTTWLGKSLINVHGFTVTSTYATLLFEVLAPLFIFLKTKNNWFRWTGAITIIGFHLIIMSSYKVANFSISGIAVGCYLIPISFGMIKLEYETSKLGPSKISTYKQMFALVWIMIMLNSSFFYISGKKPFVNSPLISDIANGLAFLDIHPVEVGPFYQKWTMFAPNPYAYTGWLAIEVHNGDEKRELISGLPISADQPVYQSKGWMFFMTYYARKWNKHENPKYFLFVKYWIHNSLEEKGLSNSTENIYLVDYERHLLLKGIGKDYIHPIEIKKYPVQEILHYPLEVYAD